MLKIPVSCRRWQRDACHAWAHGWPCWKLASMSLILGALLFQFLKNLLMYSCKPCLKPIFELHMHLQLLHSTRFLHLTTFGKENLAFHTRENPQSCTSFCCKICGMRTLVSWILGLINLSHLYLFSAGFRARTGKRWEDSIPANQLEAKRPPSGATNGHFCFCTQRQGH